MSRSVIYARRAAAAVALGVLAMGCQETAREQAARTAESRPGPTAPASATPSPVAANTAEVCRQADQAILAGGRKITTDAATSVPRDHPGDQSAAQLRRDLAELADDVRAQARRAADPQIRALIEKTADRIDTGSRAPRPAAWVDSTFTGIPPELSRHCRA